MTAPWKRHVVAPVDRALLILRLMRQTSRPTGSSAKPPEQQLGGRRVAQLPARPEKGWPQLTLPLPDDAVFHGFEEVILRRVATWQTTESPRDLVSRYRTALQTSGDASEESTAGDVRKLKAAVSGSDVEVAVASSGPGISVIGITQHAL